MPVYQKKISASTQIDFAKHPDTITRFLNLVSFNKIEKKAFICVFLISILSLSSLIQANTLYIDDYKRVFSGDPRWERDGRPLATIASLVLQLGDSLTDISPLPQILCIALYALSAIYLGKIFKVNNLVFLSLGGIAFVINPVNLQNFTYVFDSFTMGLAVFSAVAAFLVTSIVIERPLSNAQKILASFAIVFLLVSSICLYHAATSVYIAAFSFYSLFILVRNRSIKSSLGGFIFSTAMLFLSLAAYTPIKNHFVNRDNIIQASQIPPLAEVPQIFLKNLFFSVQYLLGSLGETSSLLVLMLGVMVPFNLFFLWNKFGRSQSRTPRKIRLFTVFGLSLFYCFSIIVSLYGLSLIFAEPPWKPRYFMGFSAVVGISGFFLAHLHYYYKATILKKALKYFLIFLLSLLSLSFANVSLTFGNTLHHQGMQEQMIATVLLSDLEMEISKLSTLPENPKIALVGESNRSALTTVAFRKYPILEDITTGYLGQQHAYHGGFKLRSFEFTFESVLIEQENFIPSAQPILSRRFYDMYFENNDTFVILFKRW